MNIDAIEKLIYLQKSMDYTINKVKDNDVVFAVEDINEIIYDLINIRCSIMEGNI
jgi:hypothetical protein